MGLAIAVPELAARYLERTIKAALLRLGAHTVSFDGLDVGWFPVPSLELRGLEISAREAELPFFRLDSVRGTVDLRAIGRGQLRVVEGHARGLDLRIDTARRAPDPAVARRPRDGYLVLGGRRFEVDVRELQVASAIVRFPGVAEADLVLDRIRLSGGTTRPVRLRADGRWQDFPFDLTARLGSLSDLLAGPRSELELELELGTVTTAAQGELHGGLAERALELDVTMRAPVLEDTAWLRKVDAPILGALDVRGRVQIRDGTVSIERLAGSVGASRFTGELAGSRDGERQQLRGRLVFDPFDARPFAPSAPWKRRVREVVVSSRDRDLVALEEKLQDLEIDAGLELRSILAEMPDLRDWRLLFTHDAEEAKLSFDATSGRTRGTGIARLARGTDEPRFELQVRAQPMRLIDILPDEVRPEGFAADFAVATLEATSAGRTFGEIFQRAELDVAGEAGGVSLQRPAERLEIALPSLRAQGLADGPLHVTAEVRHESERMTVALDGPGPMRWIRDELLPFSLVARGSGATIEASGAVTPLAVKPPHFAATLALEAETLARLATLPGLSSLAGLEQPLSASIEATLAPEVVAIGVERLRLGSSSGHGTARRELADGAAEWWLSFVADQIDLDELRGPAKARPAGEGRPARPLLERPLPAQQLRSLRRIQASLEVERLLGLDCEIANLRASLEGARGSIAANDVELSVCGVPITADLVLRAAPEGETIAATVSFALEDLSTAALPLAELEPADLDERLDATLQRASGRAATSGASLGGWLASLDAEVSLEGIEARYRFDDEREPLLASVSTARVVHEPESGWRLRASGRAGELPLVATATLGALPADAASWGDVTLPISVELESEPAQVSVSGQLAFAESAASQELDVSLALSSLNALDAVVDFGLPASAPWSVQAHVRNEPNRLDLSEIRLLVGESELRGSVGLERDADPRPRFVVAIESPRLRVEDFLPTEPIWETDRSAAASSSGESSTASASANRTEPPAAPKEPDAGLAPSASEGASQLTWLDRVDGRVDFRFRDAKYGEDRFGRGEIRLDLEDGRLSLDALRLDLADQPAGMLKFSLEELEDSVAYELSARFADLDYGSLAQRLHADAPSGTVSLDVQLAGRAARLDELPAATFGRAAVVIAPDQLDTELLELWGASLASAVLRGFQLGQQSHLNCAVVHLQVEDGVATADTIVLDSTNNRISGSGWLDFDARQFEVELAPRAKRATLLSIATPLQISGWYDDFQVRPALGRTLLRLFRVRQWLLSRGFWAGGRLPLDGSDLCTPQSLDPAPQTAKKARPPRSRPKPSAGG